MVVKDFKDPTPLGGSFVENMEVFMEKFCKVEGDSVTLLIPDKEIKIFVVVQDMEIVFIQEPEEYFCQNCIHIGWGHHLVSKRIYHFVIPADDEWQPNKSPLDLDTHLLHGSIHSNGFGHLLCINGLEGGSKSLSGREIMDLWDRICTTLRTRKISLKDMSRKRSMDVRLLFGVAYGHTFFGKWGYKFQYGYLVTKASYVQSLELISSRKLDDLGETEEVKNRLKEITLFYQSESEGILVTTRDLLRYMLTARESSDDIINDLLFLYDNLLLREGIYTDNVLAAKFFVKEWPERDDYQDDLLRFNCRPYNLQQDSLSLKFGKKFPRSFPPILVPVHRSANLGDMKRQVQKIFKDTYNKMDNLVVTGFTHGEGGMDHSNDALPLSRFLQPGEDLWFLTSPAVDFGDWSMYEAGPNVVRVFCGCGSEHCGEEKLDQCKSCTYWVHSNCCEPSEIYCKVCFGLMDKSFDFPASLNH